LILAALPLPAVVILGKSIDLTSFGSLCFFVSCQQRRIQPLRYMQFEEKIDE